MDMVGFILSALISLYYTLKYPPASSPEEIVADDMDTHPRVQVAGAFVLCPMVEGKCW